MIYTARPARNVTSAASRVKRKVTTEQCVVYPIVHLGANGSTAKRLLRITVVS